MQIRAKKITLIGMLSAVAFIVCALLRIKIVAFLSYEAKDVIIVMGGFIFGPLVSVFISLIVSLVEMITISDTGIIGFIMNVLATFSFALPATIIYKKKHSQKGAVLGLLMGTILMTVVMLLWNYLITPLYMKAPRQQIVGMLIPIFLPFNLVKCGLNTAITLLIYKPVVTALRKSGLLATSISWEEEAPKSEKKWLVTGLAVFILVTCILTLLVVNGKI